jgi:TATA-box binding protein (TBP) (component of TFIID and TFIIIB)
MELDDNEYDVVDIQNNNKMVEYIDVKSYNMNEIPENVLISTITLACCMGTLFKTDNIYKYMVLDHDNIISVKSVKGIRCFDEYKKRFKSLNKNSKKNFYNQNTIIINIENDRFMNIKLFKNGSIQITGCKQLSDINIMMTKLIYKLKEKLIVKDESTNKEIEITFVEDPDKINVTNFKIDLINSNFKINYWVNKEYLFNILTSKKIICSLSPIHSCVDIKYKILDEDDVYVSIFVFQTGNIIITGAKKAEHVKETYKFIIRVLNDNKQKIMKKDISKLLTAEDFKEILNDKN